MQEYYWKDKKEVDDLVEQFIRQSTQISVVSIRRDVSYSPTIGGPKEFRIMVFYVEK